MSAFGMQVGCKCNGKRSYDVCAMECVNMWDGPDTAAMVEGRRYVWECYGCGRQVCINMKLVEAPE